MSDGHRLFLAAAHLFMLGVLAVWFLDSLWSLDWTVLPAYPLAAIIPVVEARRQIRGIVA